MRIAVVADIHGNLGALEAVADDIRNAASDLVLNLGDCLSGPLDAAGTADRLMDLGWVTIRGNHDRQVLQTVESMGASDRAAAAQINEQHRAWLRTLPPVLAADPDLYLCHGTPASDVTYLTEHVLRDGAVLPAREMQMAAAIADTPGRVLLCGHTHIARLFRLRSGRIIANPGSVGCPAYQDSEPCPHVMEAGSPHARYMIMDQTEAGWRFDFRAVVYDWDRAAALARSRGREDWACALATGFVT